MAPWLKGSGPTPRRAERSGARLATRPGVVLGTSKEVLGTAKEVLGTAEILRITKNY